MISTNKLVNQLGKYLYDNIEGAFKYKNTSNMCDVYFTLLYEIPEEDRRFYPEGTDTLYDMTIDINITTYQNNIRVNVLETDANEKTLLCDVYTPEQLQDFKAAKNKILSKIIRKVAKEYREYNILF